jgi:CBS domain-containing protein
MADRKRQSTDHVPDAGAGTHLELEPLPGPTEASEADTSPFEPDSQELLVDLELVPPEPADPFPDAGQSRGPGVRNVFATNKAINQRRSPMQVNEVMTPAVECVRPNDSIAAAAQKMKELDVGALPICGDDDRLVGMITDRDITVRATAGCCDPLGTCIRDVMTPGIIYVFEDQDVAEAAQLMKENQVRRLPVLNRDKRLVGIVSLGDLAVDTGDEELAGATLEAVSEPAEMRR